MDPYRRLLLDPQAGEGGEAEAPAPEETLRAEVDAAAVDAGNEATPPETDVAAPPAAAEPPARTGLRDALKGLGLELPYETDAAALHALATAYQTAQQRNLAAEMGQQILPYREEFSEFLRQRQAQQAQPQPAGPWNPPEFDERWLNYVDRSPDTGLYVAKAGVSPAIADRVQAYSDYVNKFQTEFMRNPAEAIRPFVRAEAEALVREQLGGYQEQVQARSIVDRNNPWLYARDERGNLVPDQAGRPQYSAAGRLYVGYVAEADSMGIRDIARQDAYARRMVEADAIRYQQAAGIPPSAAPPGAVARPAVNALQAATPPSRRDVQPTVDRSTEGLSLREMLQQEFAAEGITDADLAQDLASA